MSTINTPVLPPEQHMCDNDLFDITHEDVADVETFQREEDQILLDALMYYGETVLPTYAHWTAEQRGTAHAAICRTRRILRSRLFGTEVGSDEISQADREKHMLDALHCYIEHHQYWNPDMDPAGSNAWRRRWTVATILVKRLEQKRFDRDVVEDRAIAV